MDWNLIPILEALLVERNVSRAARRLGMSQPAVSNALARLRRQFGDELLVRRAGGYELTPLAEHLALATRGAMEAMSAVSAASTEFDPATSTRLFRIAASDYVQMVLGPGLLADITPLAPRARVAFLAPFSDQFNSDEELVENTDGWLAPREVMPGHEHTGGAADRWVCVVDQDHPTIGGDLTLRDAAAHPWVVPAVRGKTLRLHLDGLAPHGVEPVVEVSTEAFASVPFLIGGTCRIGLVQESLARRLAAVANVRVLECPWPVQPLQLTFWWDPKKDGDLGHAWLRDVVGRFLDQVDLGAPGETTG
ncbi:LysR family transcriptional regulator [Nocardioides xinjiangensis]|uniref:LysR family transcriptional regulator n=1 Tax=Nocardioides xinjiangensis TaxID=2817376 RepID=UPI001B309DEC|nr:LysR family transcriptional regulator [Nocardioides sp. SYSU D00514]